MTRLLIDPAADFDDDGIGPITLTATFLDPAPATVQTVTVADVGTVVTLPAPGARQAWRLTARRNTLWGKRIIAERTVHFGDVPTVSWADLTDVDPRTLTAITGGPAIDAAVDELRTKVAALPPVVGLSQAAYDALPAPDPATIYLITS